MWGILTGRKLPAAAFLRAAEHGLSMPNAPFAWSVRGDIEPLPYANADTGFPNMHVVPDLATLRAAPWAPETAFCLMDASVEPGGPPNPLDPRAKVRTAVARSDALGLEAVVASELEFYLCTPDGRPIYADHRPWSMANAAAYEPVLGEMREMLQGAGIEVESSQTEYGPGQMELNVAPADPLTMADTATILRYVVKLVAKRHDLRATFMPVPFLGGSGSGHHLHESLRHKDSGELAFVPGPGASFPTTVMGSYIAGVLDHAIETTALNLPSINAYKRLADYSFAPNRVCWGLDHRTALIRIPAARGDGTRIEIRTPSSDANPYLIIAASIAAGADGVRRDLKPPPPINGDAYRDDTLARLPRTLAEAADVFEASAFCADLFGEVFVQTFTALIRMEDVAFRRYVTDWERERYFDAY